MYYKNFPNLFSEGQIGSVKLRNRVVMAPMGTSHTGPDLRFNQELIEFYVARAKGGAGMVISECNSVQTDIDPFPLVSATPRLNSPDKIGMLSEYADMMKYYGAVPCVQITIGMGRQADAPALAQPVSAYECPSQGDPGILCRELTHAEIQSLIKSTGRAAEFAATAGVQVLEVHGHAGYLIDQFLSPDINKRTDEYGGSPQNRFRIVKEMREEIERTIGKSIAVTLRISVDHKMPGFRTLEEGLDYCRLAEQAGFDGLHIDAGRYETMPWIFPPAYLGSACMADLSSAVKKAVKIPVISVGNYDMPDVAEKAIADGSADFIAMARGLVADPEWADKARTGRTAEIRPCVRCNEMCVGRAMFGLPLNCAVNPESGRETYMKTVKADVPKRVTVAGGGPAGLEAAFIAAKRGHQVTLFEKNTELGGLLNLAEKESFKYHIGYLKNYLINEAKKQGVKLRLGEEATVEKIRETNPDAVIVATGSDVFIPEIPGSDRENVITVRELDEHALGEKKKIVILGGGLVGCETALGLAQKGHHVTIVEMLPEVAKDLMLINKMSLLTLLPSCGVQIHTNTKCTRIEETKMVCADEKGKEMSFDYDLIIAAVGTKPVNTLTESVLDAFPDVQVIGDCVKSSKISNAIHQGYIAGNRV